MTTNIATQEATKTESGKQMSTVSFRKGYWFYFNDGERNIAAHGSSFSGKEEVYVDNALVSEKRSYKVASEHEFTIGEDKYRLKFDMVNILTGDLHCLLYKNGELFAKENKALYKEFTIKGLLLTFITCFAAGALLGVAFAVTLKYFYG